MRNVTLNCEECGEIVNLDLGVCEQCGLMFDDHPIRVGVMPLQNGNERNELEDPRSFIKPTSADIGFFTIADIKKTKNKELKRALNNARKRPRLYGQPEGAERFVIGWVEIRRICSALKLNEDIFGKAVMLTKNLSKTGFLERSYRKFACYSATIMIAARLLNRLPLRFSKIAEYSDETTSNIRKAYNEIRKELGIAINPLHLFEIVNYHCGLLGLSNWETQRCIKFAKKVVVRSGRDLYGYSAAIIRSMTNRQRKEISKLLNVSEPIITARAREMGI